MIISKIPSNLQHLFWNVNTSSFNPHEFPEFTISRVLEFGNEEAINWIRELFPLSIIQNVLKSNKQLTPKSANFWAIIFDIPLDEIAALKISKDNTGG